MIDQNLQLIENDIASVQQQMKDLKFEKNISYVYYLGITGSGKSTSINYVLAQNQLKFAKSRGKFAIQKQREGYPVIGHQCQSCTVIPSLYFDQKINSFHVDPPGFMDTKGPHQELINSYSNAVMFQRGTNVKLVVVVECATLQSGRGGNLSEVAKRLFALFPTDFDRLTNSIMILVTKVSLNDFQYDDIFEMIKDINRQNQNMGIECKSMIESICEKKNIFILPLPSQFKQEYVLNLKRGISNLKPTMLSLGASISLSFEAKSMIQDLGAKILSDLNKTSKAIRLDIENRFINCILSTVEQHQQYLRKLKTSLSIIINQSEQGLDESFRNFAEQIDLNQGITNQIIEGLHKFDFCKKLHSDIRPNFNLLESIANCLREAIGSIQAKMSKLATKQEIQEMNRRHEAQLEERRREFKQYNDRLEQDAIRRQQQAKEQIKAQKQFFERSMKQSQQQHQQSIKMLQEQIKKLANRPPQVIHHRSRGCAIM